MSDYGSRQTFGSEGLGKISAVTETLWGGYTLGEKRVKDGIAYRLCYNAGTMTAYPGQMLSARPLFPNVGPYSMTASTASNAKNYVCAAVVHHATVPASSYFWGVVRGYLSSGVVCVASCSTGNFFGPDNNGYVQSISVLSILTGIVGIAMSTIATAGSAGERTGKVTILLEGE